MLRFQFMTGSVADDTAKLLDFGRQDDGDISIVYFDFAAKENPTSVFTIRKPVGKLTNSGILEQVAKGILPKDQIDLNKTARDLLLHGKAVAEGENALIAVDGFVPYYSLNDISVIRSDDNNFEDSTWLYVSKQSTNELCIGFIETNLRQKNLINISPAFMVRKSSTADNIKSDFYIALTKFVEQIQLTAPYFHYEGAARKQLDLINQYMKPKRLFVIAEQLNAHA